MDPEFPDEDRLSLLQTLASLRSTTVSERAKSVPRLKALLQQSKCQRYLDDSTELVEEGEASETPQHPHFCITWPAVLEAVVGFVKLESRKLAGKQPAKSRGTDAGDLLRFTVRIAEARGPRFLLILRDAWGSKSPRGFFEEPDLFAHCQQALANGFTRRVCGRDYNRVLCKHLLTEQLYVSRLPYATAEQLMLDYRRNLLETKGWGHHLQQNDSLDAAKVFLQLILSRNQERFFKSQHRQELEAFFIQVVVAHHFKLEHDHGQAGGVHEPATLATIFEALEVFLRNVAFECRTSVKRMTTKEMQNSLASQLLSLHSKRRDLRQRVVQVAMNRPNGFDCCCQSCTSSFSATSPWCRDNVAK
eukprot:m.297595 g.297595  ORF g.297595 m.297595 type:complete len:361 (+) comp19529_c0_seq5:368-1450(+)